ncbi:MAG: AMP-binding protein, partial [Cyanobacteria bacterium REEB65]|nr:AMP-binding protein [Cyanobacteria bacterium REEB65]
MSNTIPGIFRQTVAAFSSREAIRYSADGHYPALTYRDYHDRVGQLASALVDLGVAPGDRVVLLSENRPEWLVVDQAVLALGAVLVPLYPTWPADTVDTALAECDPLVVFCSDAEQAGKVPPVGNAGRALQQLVCFEPRHSGKRAGVPTTAFEALLEQGARSLEKTERVRAERAAALDADCLASIAFTAGTTAEPKAVMLTHGNLTKGALALAEALTLDYQDLSLARIPLAHPLGRLASYAASSCGGTFALTDLSQAASEQLADLRPTTLVALPHELERLAAAIWADLAAQPWQREALLWGLEVGEFYQQTMDEFGRVPFPYNLLYQ